LAREYNKAWLGDLLETLTLSYRQCGRRGFGFGEEPKFPERIPAGAVNRALIQATAEAKRHVQLSELHVHPVFDLDIITVDETGGRFELRT
jgi:hypothetical protein